MTVLITAPERNINTPYQPGDYTLDAGSTRFRVTMTMPASDWRDVSDGTITLTLLLSRDGGPFNEVWADTFEHQAIYRNGIRIDSAAWETTIDIPTGSTAQLRPIISGVNFRAGFIIESFTQ